MVKQEHSEVDLDSEGHVVPPSSDREDPRGSLEGWPRLPGRPAGPQRLAAASTTSPQHSPL